jgi:protein disulfide-isomerase A6
MRTSILPAFLNLALLPLCAMGLFSPNDGVTLLDSKNWRKEVMDTDQIVLVKFFAPWCGHCKALAPEWVKAAQVLKGVAKVAAVDMDQHQALGAPYDVKGFPTLKIFGADKSKPKDYQSGRDAQSIAQAAVQEAASIVQARLGGGSGGGASSASVTLTDENFDKEVMNSDELWLVAFVAPWCGHCKALAPEWTSAANDLDGKFKMGQVDATTEKSLAQKYGVQGFPTIKYFGQDKQAADYQGGRSKSDIVTFAMDKVESSLPPPEVTELVSQQIWDDNCAAKSICLVAFFPGTVDSGVDGRNAYIEILRKMSEKQTLKKFGFLWTAVQKQQGLESAFGIGDYPALVAVNPKKSKYAQMKGSFSSQELSGFVGRLMSAREATAPFELPALSSYEAWDGKDEETAAGEEEFSLDDLMNEELDA